MVYRLEEDGSPPWEGDDMSAKFIGELVLQEILCSWHHVLQAPILFKRWMSVFVKNSHRVLLVTRFFYVFVSISDHRILRVKPKM